MHLFDLLSAWSLSLKMLQATSGIHMTVSFELYIVGLSHVDMGGMVWFEIRQLQCCTL